jgi:hypothetical protein
MTRLIAAIKNGTDAVAGLLVLVSVVGAWIAVLVWIEKAPEFLAIVISAAMISAAIAFRRERNVYNLTLGHPDSVEIMAKLRRLLDKEKA